MACQNLASPPLHLGFELGVRATRGARGSIGAFRFDSATNTNLIRRPPDELSTRQQKPLYTIFMDITFLHHIPTRMVCFTKNASHLTQSSGGPGKE